MSKSRHKIITIDQALKPPGDHPGFPCGCQDEDQTAVLTLLGLELGLASSHGGSAQRDTWSADIKQSGRTMQLTAFSLGVCLFLSEFARSQIVSRERSETTFSEAVLDSFNLFMLLFKKKTFRLQMVTLAPQNKITV